jgi:hypothetical protein
MFVILFGVSNAYSAAEQSRGLLLSRFPIVTTGPKGQRVQLSIAVSGDEFKAINLEDKRAIEVFIPRSEQATNYTQKIILQKGSIASGLLSTILADIRSCGRVIEDVESRPGTFTVSTLIAVRTHRDRLELVAVQYYAGSTQFAGLQYTVLLDACNEHEALVKVKSFFAHNVSVVHY